jgi:hypothetical protein
MVIGGRYGSERSGGEQIKEKNFTTRYDSVTKQELKTAIEKDIPVFIFIEKPVYADYETYLQNKDNQTIRYAHVDSINTLVLIDDILRMPRNNPVHQFEKYGEIEDWLRLQWAGTFRELLQRESSQKQLASLQAQVDALSAINQTLRSYMEQIITKLDPERSAEIIKTADSQLREARLISMITHQDPFDHMIDAHALDSSVALQIICNAKTFKELRDSLRNVVERPDCPGTFLRTSHLSFINEIRARAKKHPLDVKDEDITEEGEMHRPSFRRSRRKTSEESQQHA